MSSLKKKRTYPKAIKNWPEGDKPREKLFKFGEHTLSNSELLAIILRTGTKGESAVDLARKILQKLKTFRNMSHTDLRDWKEFKGLGKAKIAQIRATMEIARRFNSQEETKKKRAIKSTEDVAKLFKPRMRDLKNEIFKVILCNAKNRIIEDFEVARGTPTESYPIIREIISKALQKFASGIICIHNHPYGDPEPSREDENFTQDLKEAGKFMGIKLLDHIIFGEEGFYSFDLNKVKKY